LALGVYNKEDVISGNGAVVASGKVDGGLELHKCMAELL